MTKTTLLDGLCFMQPYRLLRQTPRVTFYELDNLIESLQGIDLVIHEPEARSPTIAGRDEWFWYMHPHQTDQLVVHQGRRIVELYTPAHGRVERFEVRSGEIWHEGRRLNEASALLGWPPGTFHRVHSPQGSVSTNYARREPGFDIRTNFNIYRVDTRTGDYEVVRLGAEDQPE